MAADYTNKVGDLRGWGAYTSVHEVCGDEGQRLYFVGRETHG